MWAALERDNVLQAARDGETCQGLASAVCLLQADIRSREYIRRTLGHSGESPAQRENRSQKEQRPNACPAGGPGAPADEGRPPECCDRSSSTDLKDPEPGFQEQKDQQLEGTGRQEDPNLWPPSPAWV